MKNVIVFPLIIAPVGCDTIAVNLSARASTFKSLKVIVKPVIFATA